jgi:hypothetical protein
VSKSRDTKESRQRREYRRQQETDILVKQAAARSAELETMRKRTQELRELRLAQEKGGRVREKIAGARVAKSFTRESLDVKQKPRAS